MKIVAVSDIHNNTAMLCEKIPSCDVCIVAGDLTDSGTSGELVHALSLLRERVLNSKIARHVIVVPGNHDFGFENEEISKVLHSHFPEITILNNSACIIDGLKFYGSPDTPAFYGWAFNRTAAELKEIWSRIPNDVDVLITHGPPYGILDYTMEYEQRPVGDSALLDRIQDLSMNYMKPLVHVFGHIHRARAKSKIKWNTSFYNVCVCNNMNILTETPTEIFLGESNAND